MLDAETVALARAALERDIAFFEANLAQKTPSGEVSAETKATAQFLIELLLENR